VKPRRKALPLLAATVALLCSCSQGGADPESSGPGPKPVRTLTRPTNGPYVSVAVDNHFHDIHPEDHIQIAADRTFIVKNEGRNLHNLSIGDTDINVNLRPGDRFSIDPLSSELEPGLYTVTCKFHESMGMVGQFEVVE
jgi:hypothetical protein